MKFLIIILLFSLTVFLKAENYAFLISAGQATKDTTTKNSDYWYDLFLAYEDLIIKEGFTQENVVVFYGDGNDYYSQLDRYKRSLHGWNNPITDYNNHFETMNSVFHDYGNNLTNNDNIVIRWVMGHGENYSNSPDHYRAWIENYDEMINLSELVDMFNQIQNYKRRKVIWMTCFSGALIEGNPNLNNDKTTIITCADWHNLCIDTILPNDTWHAQFNYVITSALYGENPIGNDYIADDNGDSVVNFEELYYEALNSPIMTSTPIIGDECPRSNHLFIDEELEFENAQLADEFKYNTDKWTASNNLIVSNNANVTVACNKSINLKPGFHAKRGSTFHGYIGDIGCTTLFSRPSVQLIEEYKNLIPLEISIFPNPAMDFIEILKPSEGFNPSEVYIRIYNLFGECVNKCVVLKLLYKINNKKIFLFLLLFFFLLKCS